MDRVTRLADDASSRETGRKTGDQQRAKELLQAGRLITIKGDRRQAHDLLRQAAMLSPYDDTIWKALYDVLDQEEDRRVCLENILAINPGDAWARKHLHALQGIPPSALPDSRWRGLVWRAALMLFAVLKYFALGLALGIIISLILYNL